MAYMISDDCISCGACESECPNQAISEGESVFIIDPAKCTECVGSFSKQQCAEICPIGAPVADPNNIESQEQLQSKWEKLRSSKAP